MLERRRSLPLDELNEIKYINNNNLKLNKQQEYSYAEAIAWRLKQQAIYILKDGYQCFSFQLISITINVI